MLAHAGSYLQENGKRLRDKRDGNRRGEMEENKVLSSDAFIMAVDATTMGRHLNFSKQEENVDCRVPFNSIAPDWGADVREFSGSAGSDRVLEMLATFLLKWAWL